MKNQFRVRCASFLLAPFLVSQFIFLQITQARQQTPLDSSFSTVVRQGILYKRIIDPKGPWRIHILQIDLSIPHLEIGSAKAGDKLFGREKMSSIVQRKTTKGRSVVAAINADFFDLKTGENDNNMIVDNEFVKATHVKGSQFDKFTNIHSQFGTTATMRPLIDRLEFDGTIIWKNGLKAILSGVNDRPASNSFVLFNHYYGPSTPTDTLKMSIKELPLKEIEMNHDTLCAIVSGVFNSGGTPLSTGMLVLAGYSVEFPPSLLNERIGDTVRIVLHFKPDRGKIRTLVGGWPRIVLDGRNIAASADSIEGTFPRFSITRHPRSGVGFSADSTTLFFFAVDGRRESGVGMSLVEFADLMISNGVYQGLNLDGGGSTTLVIDGKVVNTPSDATGERPVANCLLLYSRGEK